MKWLLKRWWNKGRRWIGRVAQPAAAPRAAVLMYHRIAKPGNDPWDMCVTPDNFRQQVEVLGKRCEVVSLEGLQERLESPRRKPLVAITFDDGYRDNLLVAKPILTKAGLPATVFLATDYLDSGTPYWWDILADLVMEPSLPSRLSVSAGGSELVWRGSSRSQLRTALWEWLVDMPAEDRSEAIRKLCTWAGHQPAFDPMRLPMTRLEVAQLVDEGLIGIGCHTAGHPRMTTLGHEACLDEVLRSQTVCKSLGAGEPGLFAYPYGEHAALPRSIVKAAGFRMACTSDEGLVQPGSDELLLPRLPVHNWPGWRFDAWLRHYWCA
ncbi:MAG: polysaccharide deacetylase family protein [Steroidobacteraceae bacterium]